MKENEKSGLPATSENECMEERMQKGQALVKEYTAYEPDAMYVSDTQTPYLRAIKAPNECKPWRPPLGYESFDLDGYNLCQIIFDKAHTHAYIRLLKSCGSVDDVFNTVVIPMLLISGTVTPGHITTDPFYNLLAPFVAEDAASFHNRTTRNNRFEQLLELWKLHNENKPKEYLSSYYKQAVDVFLHLVAKVKAEQGWEMTEEEIKRVERK
ncbi:MAG: hypothetical protein LUB83_05445 [Prevotellaceae bacterium]|nr:hypothetical protein [Prevotellaceae bacterium]